MGRPRPAAFWHGRARHHDIPASLEGTDGVKKMSKSFGNYIGLTEPAESMFGKTMSIPDALVEKYFLLCTSVFREGNSTALKKNGGPKN